MEAQALPAQGSRTRQDGRVPGPVRKEDATRKGSDLRVAALENEGVDRIFGVPGEEKRS